MTCVVQPSIQAKIRTKEGNINTVNLPLLLDCPVQFPAGGGGNLTFPVAEGDECLVVFSSRCIDAWWQQGGIQPPMELRMHDLSDGFAMLGFRSQPRVLPNLSTDSMQLRSDDGLTYISLKDGEIRINADKVIVHGNRELSLDAYGVGFVLYYNLIANYMNNVSQTNDSYNPPEVPN